MFTKKNRRNYRIGVWSAVVIWLCILIIYFAWPQDPVEPESLYRNTDPEAPVNTEEIPASDSVDNILKEENEGKAQRDTVSENDENREETVINEPVNPYYLVKRVGNEVVVFFCDPNGNMVMLETTEILYEMLGPDDQKLFDEGIQIDSQEKLSVLLQDFEG